MPSERSSPSAGWREVYDEMDADASAEEPQPCCVCGRPSSTRVVGPYCRWHRPDRGEGGDEGDVDDRSGGESAEKRDREVDASDGAADDADEESRDDRRGGRRRGGRPLDERLTRFAG